MLKFTEASQVNVEEVDWSFRETYAITSNWGLFRLDGCYNSLNSWKFTKLFRPGVYIGRCGGLEELFEDVFDMNGVIYSFGEDERGQLQKWLAEALKGG